MAILFIFLFLFLLNLVIFLNFENLTSKLSFFDKLMES